MTHVHPTRDDAVVTALSEVVGGPMGDHARPHRWWTPARVLLLLTAVVFAAGLVQKAPCSLAQGHDQNWVYSHMCYTDLKPLYVPRGMAEHAWPYSDDDQTRARYQVMEYPVGISYWAWGTAWVTHWLNGSPDVAARYKAPVSDLYGDPEVNDEENLFLLVNAVGFAALALLATWLLAGANRSRPWDAAAFALSPALLLTGLINWDLLAVALVAGALWAWSRDKPVLTGVLIGLGTAAKLYPLFLLGGLLVICLRQRRVGRFALAALWAVVAWVVANAPAYLSGPDQWKVFWSFNAERKADLGSLWLLVDQAGDLGISAHTVNVWSWVLFGAWCLGVFAIGMTAGRRGPVAMVPRLAQLGYLIVVGFLLVNKVYSPQYVLWLLPLAALARPRWRDQIVWQASEVFYFCTVWWYLGGYLAPAGGGDAGFYWVGIVVRVLGELYLAAVIVRDLYRPAHDPAALERVEPGVAVEPRPLRIGG
ncbi:glycosyltransferase 87 family protein [Nocardioides sp. QY071]|uniref:glycosyltransferase family 87 protein n=1 Tax=Nocardioides sp. QY071 TaxID=3044187 RepID=UPI00249C7FE4|nr:glycosyltransferase 87 family protein [Nocardioides sp. QY071]WGY02131.1 glycosyltransferase 87 family protein [Nocardioides sp. QY071]